MLSWVRDARQPHEFSFILSAPSVGCAREVERDFGSLNALLKCLFSQAGARGVGGVPAGCGDPKIEKELRAGD